MPKTKLTIIFSAILFFGLFGLAKGSQAANWYVDSSVASSGNGQSWGTAWKAISNITGVGAGDTIYISGGSSGSYQTYPIGTGWAPIGGAVGNPITYKIGQDSAHNGKAWFTGSWDFLVGSVSNIVISGDAGDAQMHFTLADPSTNISGLGRIVDYSSATSNVKLSYINFGKMTTGSNWRNIDFRGVTGLEIDHTYTYMTGTTVDSWAYIESSGGYDTNKIHDNTIYLPSGVCGTGADGIAGCGYGCSIYNNTIVGYVPSANPYAGNQHADGMQMLSGAYLKIYNNKIVNMVNSAIFLDAYYGGFNHAQIYNNLITTDNPAVWQGCDANRGIELADQAISGAVTFNDIIIANNTVADLKVQSCVDTSKQPGSTYSNVFIQNNLCWNTGGLWIDDGISDHNIEIRTPAGAHFVSYSQTSPSNDFHLLSNDTIFRDQGTNLSAYFTADKDNISRPQGSAWDIGAYEYSGGGGGDTTPPAAPSGLNVN